MTVSVHTEIATFLSDTVTPVSLYLNARDHYQGTLLLECGDYRGSENSISYLCINPRASIKVTEQYSEVEYPGKAPVRTPIGGAREGEEALIAFCQKFQFDVIPPTLINGFFGILSYDGVQCFESITFSAEKLPDAVTPLLHYAVFEFVLAIDHFRNTLSILHNIFDGVTAGSVNTLWSVLSRECTVGSSFVREGDERAVISEEDHRELIRRCKKHIARGDVFQIVPSRRFFQGYKGDDFLVYRALRSINPSPFLFYFDYGSYRIFGSSPEYQLLVRDGKASIFPIAGTLPRLPGRSDDAIAAQLMADPKENAEHVMLVDLARNDLSRHCTDVRVDVFREVQFYSHVVHLVSKVSGQLRRTEDVIHILGDTFPAGTLTGAPKYRAMQLLDQYEPHRRGFYGGAIGVIGSQGQCVHAIMIRTFYSAQHTLHYQAGGGVVAYSDEQAEVQEVASKLGALRRAITAAEEIRL
jgi:anthranilate synthase component 1